MVVLTVRIQEKPGEGADEIPALLVSVDPKAVTATDAEKAFADNMKPVIEALVKVQEKLNHGDEIIEKERCTIEDPAFFAEQLVNKLEHEKRSWPQIKMLVQDMLRGRAFKDLSEDELIERGKKIVGE